jgi:hypothetical protein
MVRARSLATLAPERREEERSRSRSQPSSAGFPLVPAAVVHAVSDPTTADSLLRHGRLRGWQGSRTNVSAHGSTHGRGTGGPAAGLPRVLSAHSRRRPHAETESPHAGLRQLRGAKRTGDPCPKGTRRCGLRNGLCTGVAAHGSTHGSGTGVYCSRSGRRRRLGRGHPPKRDSGKPNLGVTGSKRPGDAAGARCRFSGVGFTAAILRRYPYMKEELTRPLRDFPVGEFPYLMEHVRQHVADQPQCRATTSSAST